MNKIKKQISRFIMAGFSAVVTDTLVYFILINILDKSVSKGISFISGTIVAYVINKFWTFNKPEHSIVEIIKFAILYSVTLCANVGVNKIVLGSFPDLLIFAFLCATGTSTILNFLGQKFWVFM